MKKKMKGFLAWKGRPVSRTKNHSSYSKSSWMFNLVILYSWECVVVFLLLVLVGPGELFCQTWFSSLSQSVPQKKPLFTHMQRFLTKQSQRWMKKLLIFCLKSLVLSLSQLYFQPLLFVAVWSLIFLWMSDGVFANQETAIPMFFFFHSDSYVSLMVEMLFVDLKFLCYFFTCTEKWKDCYVLAKWVILKLFSPFRRDRDNCTPPPPPHPLNVQILILPSINDNHCFGKRILCSDSW